MYFNDFKIKLQKNQAMKIQFLNEYIVNSLLFDEDEYYNIAYEHELNGQNLRITEEMRVQIAKDKQKIINQIEAALKATKT